MASFTCKAALAVLLATLWPGCVTHQCTEMGCRDQARVSADLPAELGALAAELCMNDICKSVELAQSPETSEECVTLDAPQWGEACLSEAMNGVRRLTISIDLSQLGARDGDVYTLRVVDEASGELLLDDAKTASYSELSPNGPDCSPTCHSTELTFVR